MTTPAGLLTGNAMPHERPPSAGRSPASSPRTRLALTTAIAGVLALGYVIASPAGGDLPAQLLRAKLFAAEGFGLWDNWWYAGHDVLGYSLLFPPLAWLLTPQLVAALAAVATAAMFGMLAEHQFGADSWVGAVWFACATLTNLLSGRLTYATGLMFAVATVLALQRRRPWPATLAALLASLTSPVAALFAALAGAACVASSRSGRQATLGACVIAAALAPALALSIAFPEGGSEPFNSTQLWQVLAVTAILLAGLGRGQRTLGAGLILYGLGCYASYRLATPVGGNAARLGELLGGPLAALLWWRRRPALLLIAAVPLLYVQWQPTIQDLSIANRTPSSSAGYYRPLLQFIDRQPDGPFRIEIPFTRGHWEADYVAPTVALARGWERQLDEKYNALFYGGRLTAARYDTWLHELAVSFVAVPDAPLDWSSAAEVSLIDRGLPYLHLVLQARHWRVYAVSDPTPLADGVATVTALGPNSVTLVASSSGRTLVRVRYSPYWAVSEAPGCVRQAGQFTELDTRRPGPLRLVMDFSLWRIGAHSSRCS